MGEFLYHLGMLFLLLGLPMLAAYWYGIKVGYRAGMKRGAEDAVRQVAAL